MAPLPSVISVLTTTLINRGLPAREYCIVEHSLYTVHGVPLDPDNKRLHDLHTLWLGGETGPKLLSAALMADARSQSMASSLRSPPYLLMAAERGSRDAGVNIAAICWWLPGERSLQILRQISLLTLILLRNDNVSLPRIPKTWLNCKGRDADYCMCQNRDSGWQHKVMRAV